MDITPMRAAACGVTRDAPASNLRDRAHKVFADARRRRHEKCQAAFLF
jgi:hypothetical protein